MWGYLVLDEWISPKKSIDLLAVNGATPEWAQKKLIRYVQSGKVRCRARAIAITIEGLDRIISKGPAIVEGLWSDNDAPDPGHPFWRTGDWRTPTNYREALGVTFNRYDVEAVVAEIGAGSAPRRKLDGKPPPLEVLRPKLDAMQATMGLTQAAKLIKHEAGFENVTNEYARSVMSGRRKPGRPPKQKPS